MQNNHGPEVAQDVVRGSLAATAFCIAQALTSQPVVWLCDDDQQAEVLADAVAALTSAQVIFLPASDALPGDANHASAGNIGQRHEALYRLYQHRLGQTGAGPIACILSGEAAAHSYPAPEDGIALPFPVTVGDRLDTERWAIMLRDMGYMADDRVDEPGEVAFRGEVIDIFPAQAHHPIRLNLDDGTITAIRAFDPATQISMAAMDSFSISLATECPVRQAHCLLDHLPRGVIGMSGQAQARRKRYLALAREAAARRGSTANAIQEEVWEAAQQGWTPCPLIDIEPLPRFAERHGPLRACVDFVQPLLAQGRSLSLVGSARDLRFLRPRLERQLGLRFQDGLAQNGAGMIEMPVEAGFVSASHVVLAAGDLLGSRARIGEMSDPVALVAPDLQIGDLVVHEDHGVGRITGLEPAPDSGEMIALDYADTKTGNTRRLLALGEANRLWRYGADGDAVALDRLDGSSWTRRRAAIDEGIAQTAHALVEMARKRAKLTAPVLDPDPALYERFVAGFLFNETADQTRAIAAMRGDLASGRPMDRLVIGDVGYGKTEVALRAAALAALAGYQVVLAAPTTVLVRQHLETFEKRFAGTGIAVAGLSRLSSAAERKTVKAGLANGSIGVVIGTGAVMGPSMHYARLALVMVDEEQRFGASDKARLRGDGTRHVLTLSATPIPRTLQAAMVGLQTVSVIATPPARRQPIRTSIDILDDGLLRVALSREKGRGGQSFVVVPRIEDMAPLRERLVRVVPDLTLVEAHGKMASAEMDAAMVGFAAGQGDILLATNIIEAGLDIPRANTMIVWRADRFGLAQLHQLRGRVGRGSRRGQIHLLTDGKATMSERTLDRLRTLASFDRLGAGFEISARDLDMRGGGDLAGDSQAGHMKLIGVDLYQHLLAQALRKAQREPIETWSPNVRIGAAGALPQDWIPEPDVRLGLYGRLARLSDAAAIKAFEEELLDRFGLLPPPAVMLIAQVKLTVLARAAKVERLDAGPAALALTLRDDATGDPAGLGLHEKDGRWLLTEVLPEDGRLDRLHAVLCGLVD